jgi:cytochrome c556
MNMLPTRSPARPVARYGTALALCAAALCFVSTSPAFAKPAKPTAPAADSKGDSKSDAKPEEKADPKAEAKALVAYRSVLMQEMGKELKLAAMVTSGQVNRPQDLAAYASALASAPLAEVFPAGTGPETVQTGAKETIWTDPEGYARAVALYQERVKAFAEAAKTGDMAAAKAAQGQVGASCSNCHDFYRLED